MENKRKNKEMSLKRENASSRTHENASGVRNETLNKSYGTRKINNPSRQKRYNEREIAEEAMKLRRGISEAEKHRQMEKARKQERLKRQRIQALVGFIVALATAVVILFMTPLFNIREVRLTGNNTVHKEVINEKIGYVVGANLFSTSSTKIKKKMCEIPQVSAVEVRKHIFPTYLELFITESTPAAYLLAGSSTIVIDSDLRVIDDADAFNKDKLPNISGISVTDYQLNSPLNIKTDEQKDVISTLLKSLESLGLIDDVTYISVDDLTSIKFNYDNRIEVHCGSQLELDRKIRMFSESIKTSIIKDNSIGVFDVSVPGKASYES